ncbi:MAG TPA: preprotein translocase subunit SecE [Eubacteriales bacterium]|nr:preprotein translocase subunit SecE [Eubacteriales bacterium]
MAKNNNQLQKSGKSAPDKKGDSKAKRPLLWSKISKKFLLPASILYIAAGLLLAVYNVMSITKAAAGAETATTTGMMVSSAILGLLLVVTGVLGMMKKSKKALMTLGVMALVYAIIILTATAETGGIAIASGVVVIVLSIIFVVAVDGMFDMGLIRFFREMNGEVKKLNWLTRKELASHTLAVLVFVLAMAAIIYVLDLAFSSGFGAISNISIG